MSRARSHGPRRSRGLNDGPVTPPASDDPAILACFARQAPDLVPKVRTLLLGRLTGLKGRPRSELLELIAQPELFAPPILAPDAVAAAVEDLCHRWSWV